MIGHLRISSDDADQWQQLLISGQEQNLTVNLAHFSMRGDNTFYIYDIGAHSREQDYAVSIGVKDDEVLANCTCEASVYSTPCKHIALAIEAAKQWPFPIASQASMFEAAT